MTPAARIAAAIDVLDAILGAAPAERVLTAWGRDNRYAGSGDRAAIRDHVFDALRRRRSYAALGGAESGRGIMIGALRHGRINPATIFTGLGHAPSVLTPDETDFTPADMPDPVRCDMPEWLYPHFAASLGPDAEPAMLALRDRAPVHLRVNLRKIDRDQAIIALAHDGIAAGAHPDIRTALQITENERKIKTSGAYLDGLVELQDAASQAAILRLPLRDNDRVLDYCAGGGGKSLAMGALADVTLYAHDANAARMADLPIRSQRAGLRIDIIGTHQLAQTGPFNLVLIDAPCSGSGAWRRSPDAKWRLTEGALDGLCATQSQILDQAAPLVGPSGVLAYATCSVLGVENRTQVDRFLTRSPGWTLQDQMQLLPGPLHDGFYLAVLRRQ